MTKIKYHCYNNNKLNQIPTIDQVLLRPLPEFTHSKLTICTYSSKTIMSPFFFFFSNLLSLQYRETLLWTCQNVFFLRDKDSYLTHFLP